MTPPPQVHIRPVGLEDVLVTDELSRRAPRPPDLDAENRALHALARQIAAEPDALIKSLVAVAVELCRAGTAGVSLLEETPDGGAIFRWVAIAGALAAHVGGSTPRDFSPCGTCLDRGALQLFSYPARYFTYFDRVSPPVVEGLVAPLYAGARALGTIWIVSHDEARRFDREDARVMTSLADFSAAALYASRLRADAQSARREAEESAGRERRYREQLEAEQARLEAVLRQMPAGVILAEAPSGRLLLANEQVAQILRHPFRPAEGIEQYRQDTAFHADGRPYLSEEYPLARAIRAGEVVVDEEIECLRGDGSRGVVRASAAPIRDREGRIVAGVLTFCDMTEQKRVERAQRFLAEASAVLASSLDHEATLANVARLAVPVLADYCVIDVVEPDQSVRCVALAHGDPAKAELMRELDRRYPLNLDDPHPRSRVLRTGQPMAAAEVPGSALAAWARDAGHLEMLRAFGVTSFMVVPLLARGRLLGVLSLVAAESGRHYGPADLALAEELARRAALAVDNARLYQEAQEAVRARDAFLARASHELRTPLTSALGTIRLLPKAMAGVLKQPADSLINVARRNLDAVLALINDLLDASKLASGQERLAVEPIEVATLARASLEVVGAQARDKGVRLEMAVPPGLAIAADRLKLEQVLVNLLANAIKFTPSGGAITVEAARDGEALDIRVRDTGEGIAREHLEAIFQPFFQVRARGPQRPRGTGLGLAICRQIVTLHGGTIWAESEGPGRGSTFLVRLPAASVGDRAA